MKLRMFLGALCGLIIVGGALFLAHGRLVDGLLAIVAGISIFGLMEDNGSAET